MTPWLWGSAMRMGCTRERRILILTGWRACRALGTPPLVLHGGSGTPDDMIRKAIQLGIRKVNVATELRMAFMEGLEATVGQRDFYGMYRQAKTNMYELARKKIRLFQGK